MEVRKERTNWRDSKLKKLHNKHGYEFPCDNVEFLMLEYDMSMPVALVDYKQKQNGANLSKSIIAFCNNFMPELPYFIASYEIIDDTLTNIDIIPGNQQAINQIGHQQNLSEKEFVKIQYKLREKIVQGRTEQGIEIANKLSIKLNKTKETWPGEIISYRHRDWGWDCPAVDVDFFVINNCAVAGIVEYKNMQSFSKPSQFKAHPTGKALTNLAVKGKKDVPLIFVYYSGDLDKFKVYPISKNCYQYEEYFGVYLNESRYFEFLNKLNK